MSIAFLGAAFGFGFALGVAANFAAHVLKPTARQPIIVGQRWLVYGVGPAIVTGGEVTPPDRYGFGGHTSAVLTRPDGSVFLCGLGSLRAGRMLTASEYAVEVEKERIEATPEGVRSA